MYADYEDLGLLIEMSQEEQDEETVQEIEEELLRFEGEFEELRIQTLLTGEYDRDHAIVTLHAGAGGTESKILLPLSKERQNNYIKMLQAFR